jgi:hypothetical protein
MLCLRRLPCCAARGLTCAAERSLSCAPSARRSPLTLHSSPQSRGRQPSPFGLPARAAQSPPARVRQASLQTPAPRHRQSPSLSRSSVRCDAAQHRPPACARMERWWTRRLLVSTGCGTPSLVVACVLGFASPPALGTLLRAAEMNVTVSTGHTLQFPHPRAHRPVTTLLTRGAAYGQRVGTEKLPCTRRAA